MLDQYDIEDIKEEQDIGRLSSFIEDIKHGFNCLEAECDDIGADYWKMVSYILEEIGYE